MNEEIKVGIYCDEVFFPVVRKETIRPLISQAAQFKSLINQMNEKSTFSNGVLEKEVYVKKPPGYVKVYTKSAIKLAKIPVHHERSEHIDVSFHFI